MHKITKLQTWFSKLKIGSLFLILFCFSTHAAPNGPSVTTLDVEPPEFNFKQANKTFDQINLRLSVENLNTEHIETAISTLNKLINDAKASIEVYQKKLDGLENIIRNTETTKNEHKASKTSQTNKEQERTSADLVYLKQEQKDLNDKMAQCRLFIIRAQEAINTYQVAIAKIKQQQVLTRGMPLPDLFEHLKNEQVTGTLSISLSPVLEFLKNQFATLSVLLLICIIAATMLIKQIKINSFTQKLLRTKYIRYSDGMSVFLSLTISCIGLYLNMIFNTTWILPLISVICAYVWTVTLINLIFKIKVVAAVFYWYSLDYHFFKDILLFLLTYYAISEIGMSLAQNFAINPIFSQLIQIIFLSIVVFAIVGFVYYFCHSHRHIRFVQKHKKHLHRGALLVFLSCGLLNILGYHQLAIQMMYGCISTAAILFAIVLLVSGIQKIYLLCAYPSPIYSYILRSFGYRADQTVIEFIILKTMLQIVIGCIGLYYIGEIWGYGTYFINATYSQLLNGLHFANLTIYPTRIVAGVLIFCVLYLSFRYIATKLSRHTQFEEEEATQVAIASILIYIGFTVAFTTALFVSGIDFTGLAIVAGALSVGIGMGLQSIVNNFVSGIIILIEKHIKAGDHIRIDNTEGIVKKIRIRSTQILTSSREDIIIPNSDLINRAVVNFMYTDRYLSICCEVTVTYDNDPLLVKKLLLQAASEHDEIIKVPRAKTSVLLQDFGTSGMRFQVWFLIKDGNKKETVCSDVNFTIDRLFREHNIKFALPQRDINIKLSEIPAKIADK